MKNLRLELEEITIHRPKKRWQLYFIIVSDHPTKKDKMIIAITPDNLIQLKPLSNNKLIFEAKGKGTDGFLLLKAPMPKDRKFNVRFFLRHSRENKRNFGKILADLKKALGNDAFEVISKVFKTNIPGLEIAKKALPMVGNIIQKIQDRDLGMINMYEEFGSEFENQIELDRENKTSTGEATIIWSWSIDE
ncbi:MAG: hypothetical protein OEY34_09755 [Cyclobacteriaceae bacterium]|nr:hypothetical protein [Cyclobacteriaceae bacterium]